MKRLTYRNPRPDTPELLAARIRHVWEQEIKLSWIHNACRAYPETMARAIKVRGRYVEKECINNVIWDRMDDAPNANNP